MKSTKKIISLVLVLILAIGCLAMSASATGQYSQVFEGYYPSIKGVEFIVNSTTYPAHLIADPVSDTAWFVAYIPEAVDDLESADIKVTAGKVPTYVNIDSDPQSITAYGSHTWEDIDLTSFSGIGFKDNVNDLSYTNFPLILHKEYNVELNWITVGIQNVLPSYKMTGSVPRYFAKANYTGNLTTLTVTVSPKSAVGISYQIDGSPFTNGSSVDFSSSPAHILTVTDTVTINNVTTSFSRDYQIVAKSDAITVNVGIRTWTAVEWNNDYTDYFDYSTVGLNNDEPIDDLDELAASIDTIGRHNGYNNDPGEPEIPLFSNGRPIFAGDGDYIAVTLDGDTGYSAFNALAGYVEEINAYYSFTGTPSDDLDEMSYLSGIDGLNEMSCGSGSGWMYLVRDTVNDVTSPLPNLSAEDYLLSDGQYLDWIYTCAWGLDFGYSIFDMD